jgi:hypothetical protein
MQLLAWRLSWRLSMQLSMQQLSLLLFRVWNG